MRDSSRDLTNAILLLRWLITNKVNRTYYPRWGSRTTLDQAIQGTVQYIYDHILFATLGDDDFKDAYSKLAGIARFMDPASVFPMEERDELVLVTQELFKAENFRKRAGGEWVAPKLERCQCQAEARECGTKKVLPWGKAKAYWGDLKLTVKLNIHRGDGLY